MQQTQLRSRLVALLAAVALAISALAFDEKVISVCNTTGLTVSDLHVTFSGSGGNVTVSPASVFAGACPVPLVPSNGTVTNTVTLDWGMPCVPPGAWVTFTVRTINGPLGFVGGRWTLGGVPVGPVWPGCIIVGSPPPPPPPPPPTGHWAKKWQQKCVPNGRILRTAWMGLPGTPCWVRWVCIPSYTVYARKVRCYYANRNGRLIETARCITLVDWKKVGFRPARYKWQRTTLRPPDLNDPGNIPPIGPPKNGPRGGWEWGWKLPYALSVRYSDDAGATERIGDDMIASFFDVFMKISLEDPGTPVFPTFADTLMVIGPGWRDAGLRLGQLIPEIDAVLGPEPSGSVGAIRAPIQLVALSLQGIGTDMLDGDVDNPTRYLQLENGLTQLADVLPALDPADTRWQHASQVVERMRDGIHVSYQQALTGLTTQTQQDYFLWGLQNRFTPEVHALAHAVSPHIEFDLDIGQHGWEPSELDGVRVMVLDPITGQILDQSTLPITTNGKVFVPTLGYEDHPQLDIRLKFDTFLGTRFVVPTNLPTPILVPLVNGDVNADEIVDNQDLARVTADLGMGGPLAPFVPETDLNNDGIVDGQDQSLCLAHQGMTGQAFYELFGIANLQDYVGDLGQEELQLTSPDGLFPPRTVLVASDGEFSVAMPMAGSFNLNFKGRTWLSQTHTAFFGPGSDPFYSHSPLNGDVDGDNEVGPGDFSRLSSAFGTGPGDSFFDVFADLDGDGEVGPSDFSVLSSNFGQSGT